MSGHENNTVFIGDLPYCTVNVLEQLFSPFGQTVKIRIKQNDDKHKSLCYAFVEFSRNEDACQAIKQLHGEIFLGRALR